MKQPLKSENLGRVAPADIPSGLVGLRTAAAECRITLKQLKGLIEAGLIACTKVNASKCVALDELKALVASAGVPKIPS